MLTNLINSKIVIYTELEFVCVLQELLDIEIEWIVQWPSVSFYFRQLYI